MEPEVKVVTSYDDIVSHFDDLVPVVANYFLWNINNRYQSNPDLFEKNAKQRDISLDGILEEFHEMKRTGRMSSRQIRRLKNQFSSGQWYVLIYQGSNLAGMMRLTRGSDTEAQLHSVWVEPEFRGSGYGSIMMHQIIDLARSQGFAVIYLETMKFMNHAIKLYRSMGFIEVDYIEISDYTSTRAKEIGIIFMKLEL